MEKGPEYTAENHASELLGDLGNPDVQTTDTVVKEPIVAPTDGDKPPVTTQTETPQVTETEYSPVIDHMRSTFAQEGVTVEIPEELKGKDVPVEDVYKFVSKTLNEQTQQADPFIAQYVKAKEAGLDYNQFITQKIQQKELLALPDKEFMTRLYKAQGGKSDKNPEGWTDEGIAQHIDKLSPIELTEKTTAYKTKLKEGFDNDAMPEAKTPEEKQEAIKVSNEEAKKVAEKLFLNMSKRSDIGGIPHGQTDIDDFKPVFLDLVEKNPDTGKPRIQEMLSDDKVLYDMAYLYHKTINGGLKKYLSQFKESYKEEILERTGLRPNTHGGNTLTISVPKPEDYT